MIRRIRLLAAVACVIAATSCASLDVRALPQPGNSYRDGYDVVMEFDNVLNLPERAKVVLDGVTVGVVSAMTLARDHVDVTIRIGSGILVPSNIEAVLEQATVLGDIYVALDRPKHGSPTAPALGSGGRIPLAQTTSPPQLEDTVARLSTFVSSGSIQRIQNTIIRLNRLTPPPDEVRRLTARVTDDLSGLSANVDQVDQLLDGVARTGQVTNTHIPQFQTWFAPKGVVGFERNVFFANQVSTLLPGIGSIYSAGFWLVPLLKSLANAVGAIRQSKLDFESEVPLWRRLLTDRIFPQDKYPAINITSIVGPDGREMSGNVQDVLRMLGAVP